MKGVTVVMLMVVIAGTIIYATGAVMALTPDHVQVYAADAFVYPSDGQIVLVLAQGEYAVEDGAIIDACYRLEPPDKGEIRGTAHAVWPLCGGNWK